MQVEVDEQKKVCRKKEEKEKCSNRGLNWRVLFANEVGTGGKIDRKKEIKRKQGGDVTAHRKRESVTAIPNGRIKKRNKEDYKTIKLQKKVAAGISLQS